MPSSVSTPSVDWISVSCPAGLSTLLLDELRPVVSAVPGSFSMANGEGWSIPPDFAGGRGSTRNFGSVQCRVRVGSPVAVFSASGVAVGALRDAGLWSEYLRVLSSEHHRLTRLDVALDLPIPAPEYVQRLYKRASAGAVSLSRKALNPARHVHAFLSPGITGEDTGTVYLGGRTAEVKARVYDKRHEQLSRGGSDPGPWLRAELTVTSGVCVSMKDAWEPAPVFWHFMAQALEGIASRPPDVPDWVPGGVGFVLPPRRVLDSAATLVRRLSRSKELLDLCGLAKSVRGGSVLVHRRLQELGVASLPSIGFIPSFLTASANDGGAW